MSYKYRIFPTKNQADTLEHSLHLLRDLYNAAVQERRDAWRLNRKSVSFFDQSKQIPDIRKLNPDYMAVQARVCLQTLRQVDKAFKAFFRRIKNGEKPGYPRFKGKSFFNSFFYNKVGFRFKDGKLNLSLIGNLKIKLHRPIEGNIKEISIKREGLKWYAIISCEGIPPNPLPTSRDAIGIDVGIEAFATLSDGTQVDNPRFFETAQKQLRVAQRRVARRKKGSNRRRRAVAQLRVLHHKILNKRSDFQHKVSTWLIRHYGLVAVEKLNIKGMSRGILSKQILDASWSSFFFQLKYKAERADRQLIEVDPRNTSQTCTCGAPVKKNLSVRWHHCLVCGLSEHRDIVSSKIILARGLRDQALTYRVTESVA
jgi:putative transposase